jgi:hypothetical protein
MPMQLVIACLSQVELAARIGASSSKQPGATPAGKLMLGPFFPYKISA